MVKMNCTRRSDIPRRKTYGTAFWESLVRLGIQPVEIAPTLLHYSESEIAEEMKKARLRVDEEQREQRLQARLLAQNPDVPLHLRGRSTAYIPRARPGSK